MGRKKMLTQNGDDIYPITHEDIVKDNNGKSVKDKTNYINQLLGVIENENLTTIKEDTKKEIGSQLNDYNKVLKPKVDDIKFKEEYQGRIIDCMIGEVDDNYITTPKTDSSIVKLEYSKEGLVKVPNIKGKTILVNADGNKTDTPNEGCKLISVGEEEGNRLLIKSYNGELSHSIELPLDVPLRSLSNGVCDEIVENKLIRTVGLYIIPNSITLSVNKNWENDIFLPIFFDLPNRLSKSHFDNNILKSLIYSEATVDRIITKECVRTDSQAIYIFIKKDRLKTPNLEGFKEWLLENPMQIIYELEEPIIEELPNSIVLPCFDDTTMYIENSITPTVSYEYNALIPYKEELSIQQNQVAYNTNDVNDNIIPYLMDIEFNILSIEVMLNDEDRQD